jgi:hypothetical protein
MVERKLQLKLEALKQKAQSNGKKAKSAGSRSRSSLHKIIKTKEQAATFMKLLESA